MEAFAVRPEMALTLAVVVAFALGWAAQRLVVARSDRRQFELLNDHIARIEKQRDAAHRVALDLSASHTDLLKEQQATETMVRKLKSDLSGRYARIEKLSAGYEVQYSDINDAVRPADETLQ